MRQKGFTVIEILIATAIVAIMAGIAGQSFYKSQTVQRFETETRNVFFTILEARTNAISEKKCANGDTGKTWDVKINQSGFVLSCDSVAQETILFPSIIVFDSIKFPPAPEAQTNVLLEFLPGLAQLRIKHNDTVSKKETEIILHHISLPNEKRIICIDRVAGFPTMNVGDTCPE